VTFRIGRHSGFAAPPNAMELLLRRLGAQADEVSFAMVGDEIRATSGEVDGDSTTKEMRVAVEREVILDLIRDVCDRAPELESNWFAVSYLG
jgi:hypothetical protein